jgi:hypothetical protein
VAVRLGPSLASDVAAAAGATMPGMVLRRMSDGALAIAQPTHAWLAGAIAAAWAPWPASLRPVSGEVAMAAGIHDLAWGERDARPVLDPGTGLPQRFLDVPASDHVGLWASATGLARPFGALPALLVSRHGTRLMSGRRHEGGEEVTAHLEREARRQDELRGELARSPVHRAIDVDAAAALLAAWDSLSLHACHGLDAEATLEAVPWEEGRRELRVAPVTGGALTVEPWPFEAERLRLAVAGRRVRPVETQAQLDARWDATEPCWLEIVVTR